MLVICSARPDLSLGAATTGAAARLVVEGVPTVLLDVDDHAVVRKRLPGIQEVIRIETGDDVIVSAAREFRRNGPARFPQFRRTSRHTH